MPLSLHDSPFFYPISGPHLLCLATFFFDLRFTSHTRFALGVYLGRSLLPVGFLPDLQSFGGGRSSKVDLHSSA